MKSIIEELKKTAANPNEVMSEKQEYDVVVYKDLEMVFKDGKVAVATLSPHGMALSVTDVYVDNETVLPTIKLLREFADKICEINQTTQAKPLDEDAEELSAEGVTACLNQLGITND